MSSFCLSIDQVKEAVGGNLVSKNETFIYRVSTDSRTLVKGDLFIPLVGENFDGHKFINQAVQKGAACILTAQDVSVSGAVTLIRVVDTLKALQDLAKYYRKLFPFQVVGITGSNGKTTTKFFTHTLLSQKYKTFASQKSFNNHFGVPLTLLSLDPDTQYGICEIGMNHAGEIAALTQLASPDISLCTSVGRAHLMDFGKVDGIYQEKKDIYAMAPAHNKKVFNLDNEWTFKMYELFKDKNSLTFSSQKEEADVHLKVVEMNLDFMKIEGHIGGIKNHSHISVFGEHNIFNLMGASAIALHAGLSPEEIWKGLSQCQTVWGRSQKVLLESGAHLIFDGYNANPESVTALAENLEKLKCQGQKFFLLGDMLEMGERAQSLHYEMGELVGSKNFDVIVFAGQYADSFGDGLKSSDFSKNSFISNVYEDSLAIKVANMLQPGDVLVIKGSRGSRMERFIPFLKPQDEFKV